MSNKKIFQYVAGFFGVGLVVYNVLVFVLSGQFGQFDGTFWTAWAFTILAFISQFVILVMLSKDRAYQKDRFLGLPLLVRSTAYFIVQLIAGALMMIIHAPFVLTIVIEVIAFAVYAFVVLKAAFAKDIIAANEEAVQEKTRDMRTLSARAAALYNSENNETKKAELKKLYEALKYSSPASDRPDIIEMNKKITDKFDALDSNISRMSPNDVSDSVGELMKMISTRSIISKQN